MRRNARMKHIEEKSLSDKIILYCGIGVAILAVIVIGLLIYSKSLNDDVRNSTMSLEEMANIASNTQNTATTESASTEMGKSVEEAEEELVTESEINMTEKKLNEEKNTNATNISSNTQTNKAQTNTTSQNSTNTANASSKSNQATEKQVKELSFAKPVDGEIVKEYSKDNLLYSNTLEEWTTHLGIDIKADKTTVVKAAEEGTIKTIKNDPRYGLTIVIEHENGFQTVYSNLLTSEFVVEGEKVEKGQSIGTVGNTAVFEIADETHLHFEIWKDSIAIDPNIYLK